MSDIVATWPKAINNQERPLARYLEALKEAERTGQEINFRVSTFPREPPERCYMVYDGFVRGWTNVVDMAERDDVIDPQTGERMAPGRYIVREPLWFPLVTEIPMKGFQGWRYFDRSLAREQVNL